jgi:hypothetical protein
MEAVAARRTAGVAVVLRTAAGAAVVLHTAAEVVVAEADRIIDPGTFPKGSPISSRRAFWLFGSMSPAEEPSHNSPMVRVFYR